MPFNIAAQIWVEGLSSVPGAWMALRLAPWVVTLYLLKVYFGGARCTAERNMHGKVVIMTGATSGIGAALARELASRGAQLVLLTQHTLDDPFLADFIFDMRASTHNELITAERVDLRSLHSIRQFATRWVDNAPPRRLDMVVLCADTQTPNRAKIRRSEDGVESTFAVNYLANFHLLSILSPALRAQPPDRDVRVLVAACGSYIGGHLPAAMPLVPEKAALIAKEPSVAYAASKLSLMVFAAAFQKHLSSYVRPDKQPAYARVYMIDPGWSRTPGMRAYLTMGKLWGLAFYLLLWPFWWLILKSPVQGAQTFLHAAMDEALGRQEGGRLLRECESVGIAKTEVADEDAQKKLWELSEKAIVDLEKKGAQKRAKEKKTEPEEKVDGKKIDETAANGTATGVQGDKTPGSRRSRKKGT